MQIRVVQLEDAGQFAQAEQVQMSAWGMEALEVTPKEVMIAINDNGGAVLGAFRGREMVGFALTLPGYLEGHPFLYSHMTGVARDFQSRGVGYLLKQKQKEIALQRGLDLVAWTFDPIISKNAYFNFRKVGVVARTYLPNYYGPMNDSINVGWETDRFLCEWRVRDDLPARLGRVGDDYLKSCHVAIQKRGEEPHPRCVDWEVDLRAPGVLVDIPSDVVSLKAASPREGKRWRVATREVFQSYFTAGFTAVALLEQRGTYRYLLRRARMPRNIFSHVKPSNPG